MSDVLEAIEYTSVAGDSVELKATVYALSTCAFCKRGMEFLDAHGVAYRYVFLDELDFDTKRAVKQELKSRYKDLPVFPILTIGNERATSGFRKKRWAELLNIEYDESPNKDE